jgi:hypothetical protein
MEAVTARTAGLARPETLLAASLGLTSALLVALLAPPGGDAAAHLYRTELVREGVHLWDNLWYGGHYPLASYSVLYYLASAVVGNLPLAVAATVVSAALFAGLAAEEWGEETTRWPIRLFAVLAAGPVFTGTWPYAVGLAAALGTLRLLQLGRTWPALACAALALGASPLAFAFLGLALVAVAVSRRTLDRATWTVGGGLAALALLQLGIVVLFPVEGEYSYSTISLAGVLGLSAMGAALALRSHRSGALAPFFVLWGLVNLAAFFVASPFGDNLARLRHAILPLILLTAILARFRPRPLVVAALGLALYYNVAPDLSALPKRIDDARTAEAAYWEPALTFLRGETGPEHRVAVVPTFGHWEAYFVPDAGFALARGWYRQLDIADNPELYRDPLTPEAYRRWLKRLAVSHVLLPNARLGALGAPREAALLRSGAAGLRPVFESGDWTVYAFPDATTLLSGSAPATVQRLTHDRIEGTLGAPGSYRLRVRYAPVWQVEHGAVCVERAPDGMTRLVAREGGRFALGLPSGGRDVVHTALTQRAGSCR